MAAEQRAKEPSEETSFGVTQAKTIEEWLDEVTETLLESINSLSDLMNAHPETKDEYGPVARKLADLTARSITSRRRFTGQAPAPTVDNVGTHSREQDMESRIAAIEKDLAAIKIDVAVIKLMWLSSDQAMQPRKIYRRNFMAQRGKSLAL